MRSTTMSHLARVNVLFSIDEAERFNTYCSRHGFKKSTLIGGPRSPTAPVSSFDNFSRQIRLHR
jgi:hypothetical protein